MAFSALAHVGRFGSSARGWQRPQGKKCGGVRPITRFNWVDKARQYVLKSALTPFANLHEAQFMLSRDTGQRGPAAVRRSLLAALDQCSDDSVFMQFDVVNFYGSIFHAWLEERLHLDPAIIRRQIHSGGMTIEHAGNTVPSMQRMEPSESGGRWGIPQGSRLSSLIAELTMADILRSAAVFLELPLFVWSDNLGIIVPRVKAMEVEQLVREAFGVHEAGPFELTVSQRSVRSEFKFLGTWYQKEPNGARAFIPDAVVRGWEMSVEADLLHSSFDELDRIEKRVISKLAQWAWCPRAKEAGEHLKGVIQSLRGSTEQNDLAA